MIKTRLAESFGIDHPLFLAPMAFASGGKLAPAATNADGLGLIGGSYGDRASWKRHSGMWATQKPAVDSSHGR